MFNAKNEAGETVFIDNAVSGQKYFCPSCSGELIVRAKNSTKKLPHFAHKCRCTDTWHYEETSEWHRDWQSRFPVETREVRVTKDGVNHRADVLINNVVIEFQHSPISAEEFSERNRFYKNCGYRVVWVFDAQEKAKWDPWHCSFKWSQSNPFSGASNLPDYLYLDNVESNYQGIIPVKWNNRTNSLNPIAFLFDSNKNLYNVCLFPYNSFLKEYGAIEDVTVQSITNWLNTSGEYITSSPQPIQPIRNLYDQQPNLLQMYRQINRGSGRRKRRF